MIGHLRIASALLAGLALGGCAVVSEAPLFGPGDGSAHPLAAGVWAMSGPGCDVGPGRLPDCAVPVTISKDRFTWELGPAALRTLGPAAAALTALPFPKTSAYVLVDGDPMILELLNGEPNAPAPAASPTARPLPPLKPGYLALRPDHIDAAGRIDRAVAWPVTCPSEPAKVPGFDLSSGKCIATTPDAVRRQAPVIPTLQSAFLTWVRALPAPP